MINIRKEYKRRFLKFDLAISIVMSIIIIILYIKIVTIEALADWISINKANIYGLIATIGGTLLGFVITGASIIVAFSESEKLELLKKSKQYNTIFEIYFSTIRYLAIATIIAILGIIINSYSAIILYVLTWAIIISVMRLYRCLWILEKIVKIIQG